MTVIILPILLLCHSILSSCHTIILDNRRPDERKSCSKVTCSKYLSPGYLHHDDHWPSFFKRRKDTARHSFQGLDDVGKNTFNSKDLQDIETLDSELETVERHEDGNNNDYSKGNDVAIGRRKRRGITEYGTMQELRDEGRERDMNLIYEESAPDLSWQNKRKSGRLKMSRGKRSSSDRESKQRAKEKMKRIRCCQRLKEKEGAGEGGEGSSGELKDSDKDGDGNLQQEFNHRFGSSLPAHHPHPTLPLYPPPFHPHSSLPSDPIFFPPFIPNIPPFDPFSHSLAHHQNSLHLSLLGPSTVGLPNPLFGFNQNVNRQMLVNGNLFPPPTPSKPESKSEMEEEPMEDRNEGQHNPVDEEDEEARRIDHEMRRKRHFMLMSGQYQPYEPWIHGPIIPPF